MSTKYDTKAPGVYVEYVSNGSKTITAVGTSVAGFVGDAPDGPRHVNEAVQINNWTEFHKEFVGDATTSTPLSHAVRGFFENGGSLCYVVNVAGGPITGGAQPMGLDLLATIDAIAIVAAPGRTSPVEHQAVIAHCEQCGDRVGILDAPVGYVGPTQFDNLKKVATDEPAPRRRTPEGEGTAEAPSPTPAGGLLPPQSDKVAYYYPYIKVRDVLNPRDSQIVEVPPSGHIAGIWARNDALRGVHKAPANERILGAVDVTHRLTPDQHGQLNVYGVNVIRFYSDSGVTVMGARTRGVADSEFRYLNVRRLTTMIQESIEQSTRWVIFEPNDRPLWNMIIQSVTSFLTRVWRDGALMGTSPAQAFFVKCDEETNPQENIDAGIVTVLIGLAPVKPAEFLVFKIRQGVESETPGTPAT